MDQIQLFRLATSLKPGTAYTMYYEDFREAAARELTGLDYMGGAREEDVNAFADKISRNWDIKISIHCTDRTVNISKPEFQREGR